MSKIINQILFYLKVILLLIVFVVTFYILLIRMEYNESNFFSTMPLFIPFLGTLSVFVFSFFLNNGNDNLFFNISCVLVLLAIIIVDYRTIFDNNIISLAKINLNYFDGQINHIAIILYLTIIGNLLLIVKEIKEKNKIHS